MKIDCKQSNLSINCNCTYPCSRKGKCCECIAYHHAKKQLPFIFFSADDEKTYNRSIEVYMKSISHE